MQITLIRAGVVIEGFEINLCGGFKSDEKDRVQVELIHQQVVLVV